MEMEDIAKEPDAGEGPSETGKTEDEIYSKLQSPSEDLYSDAKFLPGPSKQKQALRGERLWRLGCICLGAICLILVLTIIVLVMKVQNEASACEVGSSKSVPLNIMTQGYLSTTAASTDGPIRALPSTNSLLTVTPHLHKGSQSQNSLCPPRWLYSSNSCFFLSTERKTWDESRTDCRDKSGDLAVITDPALKKFLTDNGQQQYWVGLRQSGGVWEWVSGERFNENSLKSGGDECGMLVGNSSGKAEKTWSKLYCGRPRYYICQKSK